MWSGSTHGGLQLLKRLLSDQKDVLHPDLRHPDEPLPFHPLAGGCDLFIQRGILPVSVKACQIEACGGREGAQLFRRLIIAFEQEIGHDFAGILANRTQIGPSCRGCLFILGGGGDEPEKVKAIPLLFAQRFERPVGPPTVRTREGRDLDQVDFARQLRAAAA